MHLGPWGEVSTAQTPNSVGILKEYINLRSRGRVDGGGGHIQPPTAARKGDSGAAALADR